METRILLNPGETLLLHRGENAEAAEKWIITGFVGEGGACVCYTARSGSKSGRLKEFYPLDSWGRPCFSRSAEGFLTGAPEQVETLCREFRESYRILEQTKKNQTKAEILNNFIPAYELLMGEGGTAYVWTPDDKQGVSFEAYLSEVRADPKNKPEHKLYNIINTILTLTDCIRVLHDVGLLHLDIKPSNFMVLYDGDYNINPGSISLFDVNTLYPIGSKYSRMAGTQDYCAPEVYKGKAENRSDIYSIGMMLLRFIVFSAPFRQADLTQMDALVAESPLIRASETNSNVFLRHTLAKILKKCLALRPSDRYDCCEDLMEDLQQAKTFLLPEVAGEHLGLGKRLAILDTEPQDNCSPAAVMQNLLFRHPLYENLESGERDIHVLVVGAGTYGQKFIDICLQAGQILGYRLHIRAVSKDPELDRQVYLQVRPALPEFVNCNGSLVGKEGYADLDFDTSPVRFRRGESAADAKLLLDKHPKPHFVFVSLGDDELNRDTAKTLAKALQKRNLSCGVHYVVQSDAAADSLAHPVYINAPLTAKTIDPRLEKWAFNAHLCWMTDPEDIALARKQFRQKYNLESSLAYALSIRSKLFSVGVSEENPGQLVQDEEICFQLAALEHRRWVLDKVTSGWAAPRNRDGSMDYLTGILRGDMKDKKKRLHPCIVRSGRSNPLKNFTPAQWEESGIWDEGLDELDTVSVQLHRHCKALADKRRTEGLPGDLVLMQRRIAALGPDVNQAFGTYRHYLQQVLRGDIRATKGFDGVENRLKTALFDLEPQLRREILTRMQQIRRDFFPVIESNLYRNYKDSDEALIRQIPFVLTHTPKSERKAEPGEWTKVTALPAYDPQPIDTENVALPQELLELTEKIAENVHDVWAAGRIKEGWIYGENRDNDLKTTPCLVPYGDLPENEKEYDRRTAMETLKLIIKLGYKIEP